MDKYPAELVKKMTSRQVRQLVKSDGSIADRSKVEPVVEAMYGAGSFLERFVWMKVLRQTTDVAVLRDFTNSKGWDLLNDWLDDCVVDDSTRHLHELLLVYQHLPIELSTIQRTRCAKTIRSISRTSDSLAVANVAKEVVNEWKKVALPAEATRRPAMSTNGSRKPSVESQGRKDAPPRPSGTGPSWSSEKEKKPTTDKGKEAGGPSAESRAEAGAKTTNAPKKSLTTVKTVGPRFRSTGLEQELPPPKRGRAGLAVKTTTSATDNTLNQRSKMSPTIDGKTIRAKPEPDIVADRKSLELPVDIEVPPQSTSLLSNGNIVLGRTTAISPTDQSGAKTVAKTKSAAPATTRGPVKRAVPAPKERHTFQESNSFMNELFAVSNDAAPVRKRPRNAVQPTTARQLTTARRSPSVSPAHSSSAMSPNGERISSYPSSSSSTKPFYGKDSLAAASSPPEPSRSPAGRSPAGGRSNTPTPPPAAAGQTPPRPISSATGPPAKSRKRVTWAADEKLTRYHYFELDETERCNVNRQELASWDAMRKREQILDMALFRGEKTAIGGSRTSSATSRRGPGAERPSRVWRPPPPIDDLKTFERGKDSVEKNVQADRVSKVLQALYFSNEEIPDSAEEPDADELVSVPLSETVAIIPLEHVETPTGSREPSRSRSTTPQPMEVDAEADGSTEAADGQLMAGTEQTASVQQTAADQIVSPTFEAHDASAPAAQPATQPAVPREPPEPATPTSSLIKDLLNPANVQFLHRLAEDLSKDSDEPAAHQTLADAAVDLAAAPPDVSVAGLAPAQPFTYPAAAPPPALPRSSDNALADQLQRIQNLVKQNEEMDLASAVAGGAVPAASRFGPSYWPGPPPPPPAQPQTPTSWPTGAVYSGLSSSGPMVPGPVASGPMAPGPMAPGPMAPGPKAPGPKAGGPAYLAATTSPSAAGAGSSRTNRWNQRPCTFFNKAGGCRNGAECPFAHIPEKKRSSPPAGSGARRWGQRY